MSIHSVSQHASGNDDVCFDLTNECELFTSSDCGNKWRLSNGQHCSCSKIITQMASVSGSGCSQKWQFAVLLHVEVGTNETRSDPANTNLWQFVDFLVYCSRTLRHQFRSKASLPTVSEALPTSIICCDHRTRFIGARLRFPRKEKLYVTLISKWHITELDNLLHLEWIIRVSLPARK